MSETIDFVRTYLAERFPDHRVTHEWDRSRGVHVFRIQKDARIFQAEFSRELLDEGSTEELERLFHKGKLVGALRGELRVIADREGIHPLPWRKEGGVDPVDEASRESFPASDPPAWRRE